MKYFLLPSFTSAVLIVATIQSASAIITRHDVDDKQYLDLGEQYTHSTAYIAGCAATVIDPHWLVTAAHCVAGREASIFYSKHIDKQYRVETIIVYPEYVKTNDEVHDIALVQLKDKLINSQPAKVYSNKNEVGMPVIFIGRGTYGNGKDGLIKDDGKQRGATNIVNSATEQVIGFEFTAPPQATQLEGISSRGDSGGPAFYIDENNQRWLIGVSSYQIGNGFKEGNYGVAEFYTRVSTYSDWISSVTAKNPAPTIPQHKLIDAVKSSDITLTSNDKDLLNDIAVMQEFFYQAVINNRIKSIKSAIELGAPIEQITINNVTLIEFSLQQSHNDIAKMLMYTEMGQRIAFNKESYILALFIDRFKNDDFLISGVKQLVAQGANINAQTRSGDTALIIAGWSTNNVKLIKLLIDLGADLNIANNNGDTPLIDAAYLKKPEILKILLANGANTSHKNNRGLTALDVAQQKGHQEIINKLAIDKE